MKKLNQKGITLVALVITIIVLMILAGVSLSFVLGDNGILKKAQESTDAYKNASQSEQQTLQNIENYLYGEKGGNNTGDNTTGGGDNTTTGGGGSTNPPTTNKISKSTSYVGYYADIDADGTVDGVIYADKAVGGSGSWGSSNKTSYTIPTVTEGLKDYSISQESYTGKFGTKAVISPTGTGEERFYIMALTDIDGKTEGTYYDWYHAAYDKKISDWSTITSTKFGTGKTNTATMIAKWNAKAYGDQDTCSYHKDMWGQIQTKVKDGWFVPSKEEWAAFGGELGISKDSSNEKYYGNFGLSDYYWSSSLFGTYVAWYARFTNGSMGNHYVREYRSVRLGATF